MLDRLLNSLNNDTKKLLKEMLNNGWDIARAKKHIVLKHESGRVVSFSKTPSDRRALLNMKAIMQQVKLESGMC